MNVWRVLVLMAIPMLVPGSAFALQGENISFPRLDGQAFVAGAASSRAVESATNGALEDNDDDDRCSIGELFAIVSGIGSSAVEPTQGIGRASSAMQGLSKLTTPIGVSAFVPNHCISLTVSGDCVGDLSVRALVSTNALAVGRLTANYATSPGLAGPPTPMNQFGTMDVFLHFLGDGIGCSNLAGGEFDAEGCGVQRVADLGFTQAVTVGDTNIAVTHVGDGVFVTSGVVARSTEKSFGNFTEGFLLEGGCGVNHFWTARQRVPLDSMGATAVNVTMNSGLGAQCNRFSNGSATASTGDGGASPFRWISVCSAFFFARDYCIDESGPTFDEDGILVDENGDPVPDPDPNGDPNGGGGASGVVGCHPLKVLIDDSKGGIGPAEINGTTLPAFNGLDTVTVMVAAGSDFQCDLEIFDSKTGQLVASLDAAEATYDAATGIAVFDLSMLDPPIEPGLYDVRVGSMFLAEVYAAIPGDVNLDGTVDVLNDAFVLIGNLGRSMGVTWFDGDVNCDGRVDVLGDAFALVTNLSQSVCP